MLNLVSGMYGRGYGDWARRYAREVIEIEVPYDSSVPAASVAETLRARPDITVVSVVHCETPCGTVNDLDAISAVVAGHGALLIVDAVSTFGGIRCDFTAWQADVAVTAPQKCLGGPPGLSLLHVSEAAWAHMAANPAAPRGSVLSILDWRDAHLAVGRSRSPRRSRTSTACTPAWSSTSMREPRRCAAVTGPPPGPRGQAPRPSA